MRGIFKAIARALRSVMRRLRATAAWGAGVIDAGWASLFGGGGYVEEDVDAFEDAQVANDNVAAGRALTANAPAPAITLADRVKAAGARRDASQTFDDLFDENDPLHRKVRAWVASLDECGLRALRHMPVETIGRHLDPKDRVRGAGLPTFDPLAPEIVPVVVTGRLEEKATLTARGAAAEIIRQAKERGREPSLADVLAAGRRAYARGLPS